MDIQNIKPDKGRLLADDDILFYTEKSEFSRGGVGFTLRTFLESASLHYPLAIREYVEYIKKAQDEISFKAGVNEVVEFIEIKGKPIYGENLIIFEMTYKELRDIKLKAGINEIV